MSSLQTKLGSSLFLSLVLSFTVMWLLVSININYLAKEYVASRLKHDSERLLSSITIDKNGDASLQLEYLALVYKQPFSGHYYVISTENKTVSSRSLWDFNLATPLLKVGQQTSTTQVGPEHQNLITVSSAYLKSGHKLSIVIAEDLNPLTKNISQFKYWFIAIAISMLIVLVIFQSLILRYSLNPLRKTHSELKQLEKGIIQKLNTDHAPSELKPLIEEINYLLSLMQQRLTRSRNALSDLAHAIKKPLTLIQLVVDKEISSIKTKELLLQQSNSIYQISDRILKKARLAGQGFSGALFSFEDDLPDLIKTLEMIHAAKNVHFDVKVNPKDRCPIDREDMLELLGNLLDNAFKWAKHNILLTLTLDSNLNITVEDDGMGANEDQLKQLLQRGIRLDESVEGHGFGLSIVHDIVIDYKGSIYFSKSTTLRGFKANIKIPVST